MTFSFKNLVKGILFVAVLGSFIYYVVDQVQYKNNLMDVEEYSPVSTLISPVNEVKRSKYPFVDIHNHQFDMPVKDLSKLVAEMDSLNMGLYDKFERFSGNLPQRNPSKRQRKRSFSLWNLCEFGILNKLTHLILLPPILSFSKMQNKTVLLV